MTKKKRGHPDAEDTLARPWCYYCERDFDDLKILISHQKAKHFKCGLCSRRLNTAGGLSVHMTQVHKETLTEVENALPNRSDLTIEIFGMEGIPEDVVAQHKQRVLQQFYEAQAQRHASTGNPPPGNSVGNGQGPVKKLKIESKSERMQRLAEHRAKKAAGVPAGDDDNGSPQGANVGSPGVSQSPVPFSQNGFAPTPAFASPTPPIHPQQYGQPGIPQQPPYAFGPPPQQYPQAGLPQAPHLGMYPPLPQQQSYGATSPPPLHFIPPGQQSVNLPRPAGLPSAPGLPQRPSVAAPLVNAYQMQQFHQGHIPGQLPQPVQALPLQSQQHDLRFTTPNGLPMMPNKPNVSSADVDDLIANAVKDSDATLATKDENANPATPITDGKKAAPKKEKEKDKATKMIFKDIPEGLSPEERMATSSRYAFNPAQDNNERQKTLGEAQLVLTGTVNA